MKLGVPFPPCFMTNACSSSVGGLQDAEAALAQVVPPSARGARPSGPPDEEVEGLRHALARRVRSISRDLGVGAEADDEGAD